MKNIKKGFTLAEVLIALTILGVVAAIGITSLVQNYKKRITIVKLQRAYETLERAVVNIKIATGCSNLECTGLLSYTDRKQETLPVKFFELGGITIKKKYSQSSYSLNYKALNYNNISSKKNALVGIYVMLTDKNNIGYDMSTANIYLDTDRKKSTKGLVVTVFTDPKLGYKSENIPDQGNTRILKDVKDGYNTFNFLIYDNFIVEPKTGCAGGYKFPLSVYSNANDGCNKNGTTNCYGNSCAARIMKNGWKIDY